MLMRRAVELLETTDFVVDPAHGPSLSRRLIHALAGRADEATRARGAGAELRRRARGTSLRQRGLRERLATARHLARLIAVAGRC